MNKNELFDFEKIDDYRGHIISNDNKEMEKFDINRKFNDDAFNDLLTETARQKFK